MKQRIESTYLEAFPNGSLVAGFERKSQRFFVRQPTGCGDLALPVNPGDPIEGPVYISCLKNNELGIVRMDEENRYVSKCCPKGQILSSESKRCEDLTNFGANQPISQWPMPPRQILDPETLLPTTFYRSRLIETVNEWCSDPEMSPIFEVPRNVFTNGSASFGSSGILDIVCLDSAVDVDRDLDGPVAIVCGKKERPATKLPDDPRNDCTQDDRTTCLPKCCPADNIFDVREMRCVPSNESNLYRPKTYRFERNLSTGKNNSYNIFVDESVAVASTDYYVKYMHLTFCPSDYGFLPRTTHVLLLTDGRLFIDNGAVAEIYDDGFCIDNFVNGDDDDKMFVSAFVCNNVVHTIRYGHGELLVAGDERPYRPCGNST